MRSSRKFTAAILTAHLALGQLAVGMPIANAVAVTAENQTKTTRIFYDDAVVPGGELALSGTGWKKENGAGGATIVVKLRYELKDGSEGTYERTGEILKHPTSGAEDVTMWALITSDANGAFSTSIPLPASLQPGQKLTINVASGLVSGDANASITTDPLVVGGVPWVDNREKIKCVTDKQPGVKVAPQANPDRTLDVEGWGYCNSNSGGVKIAVKLDQGGVSRNGDNKVDANATIWQWIESDPHDGTFKTQIQLPDGTTQGPLGSKKPFEDGKHSVIFLTGSTREGDPKGALKFDFIVGQYNPGTQAPDPINTSQLTAANALGMTTQRNGGNIVVTLPQATPGDWVFASAYSDGGPKYPWTTWQQLDANQQFSLNADASGIPGGNIELVVQSGNQATFGEVVGWQSIKLKEKQTATSTTTRRSPTGSAAPTTGILGYKTAFDNLAKEINNLDKVLSGPTTTPTTTPAATVAITPSQHARNTRASEVTEVVEVIGGGAAQPAPRANANTNNAAGGRAQAAQGNTSKPTKPEPTTTPQPPMTKASVLNQDNVGVVTGKLHDDGMFVATINGREEGDWVYVYGFTPEQQDFGWVQLDAKKSVPIDVSQLGPGEHKFMFVDEAGKLLGWSGIALTGDQQDMTVEAPMPRIVATSSQRSVMTSTDWLLIVGSIALVQLMVIGTYVLTRTQQRSR